MCAFLHLFFLKARLFDEPQLASLCLDTIDKSTGDAINAEGFTDIDLGKRVSAPLISKSFLFLDPFFTCIN